MTVISYLLLHVVLLRLQVAEEFLFLSARRCAYIITTFHSLLIIILLSQPPWAIPHLTARAYLRVVIFTVFIIILLFVSLLPFFRWLPVRLG